MAIDLKILGWSAEGLRCPDHKVSFVKKDGSIHSITLLQMPNGTGKTTTLRLLRAALSGPAIWTDSFDKPIQFRKDKSVRKGKFELSLSYGASKRLTITMNFDFTNEGSVTYTTVGPMGKELEFRPPAALTPILKPDFVKLLVFDGELAATLLDSSQTNAQSAIEEIYQLSFLHRMGDRIDEYWKANAQNAGSRGSQREFTQRRNKVDALQDRINEVKYRWEKDEENLDNVKQQLSQLDEEFQQEMTKNADDEASLKKAENGLNQAILKVSDKSREAATLMKNPAELSKNISVSILALKDSLDKAQLPGIAAREFFVEISEQDQCICGRAIDKATQKHIREGAQKYLGSEEVAVLNAMKSDIKERISNDSAARPAAHLKQLIKEIKQAQHEEMKARQKLDAVKESVSDHDPEIRKLTSLMKTLGEQKGRWEKEMEKYEGESDDSDGSWNLIILHNRLKEATDDLADASDTIEQKEKRDILCRIFEGAYDLARKTLSEAVCMDVNKKIRELMPHNHIQIASIDKSLRLAEKEGGSVGETLAVGYAFLSSLLSNSNHLLPAVVDSPSGPIDLQIRPEIAKLIPRLGQQFIAFTISSEREGFIKPLMKASRGEIEFITLFRKGNKTLEKSAKSMKQCQETVDGLLVTGQTYFENFHSDKE